MHTFATITILLTHNGDVIADVAVCMNIICQFRGQGGMQHTGHSLNEIRVPLPASCGGTSFLSRSELLNGTTKHH